MSPSDNTIFLTLAGSQAHGTARAGSDVDLRGVCIAPLSVRLSIFRDFEQYEGELPDALSADVLPRLKEHPTASQALALKTECVIRLMRMGLEVLEAGELRVRRHDAVELSAIRDGALSFDELLAAAASLQGSMEHAAKTTSLPADIQHDAVDALLTHILLT